MGVVIGIAIGLCVVALVGTHPALRADLIELDSTIEKLSPKGREGQARR